MLYTIARTLARARSRLASDDPASHDRGQSEVFGVVLLVGLVVVAATTLLVVGFGAVTDGTNDVADAQAERAMAQFDTRASRVALGEASVQRVDMGRPEGQGSLTTEPDAGRIRVETVNTTTGVTETEIVNVSLGAVVYREAGTTVAYQGGGVWRSDGDGSVMLSRPEFHFENDTLTVPVVVVEGEGSVDDRLEIVSAGPSERKFPNRTANLTNEVEDVTVRVTVQSDYYDAWAEYFRESTNSIVFVNDAEETATVVFLTGGQEAQLASGIIATGEDGEVRLGGQGVYIDSYDSANGTYKQTRGSDGEITAVGDVVSTGSATVEGDVRSGAVVDLSGETEINNGTVYWTEDFQQDGAAVAGGDEQIDGVATVYPIDGYVRNVVTDASRSNDNENTSVIQDGEFAQSGTLDAGTYYVDNLVIGPGDDLTLNTSGGDVTIAVADYVEIAGSGGKAANLTVEGDGVARIVVAGHGTGGQGVNFYIGKNSLVDVPAQNSTQFRVYGTRSFTAEVFSNQGNTLRFEGVIYAPGGPYGTSSILVRQGDYYGGLVAADLTIKQYAEVHYDQSLEDTALPRSPTAPRLRYMHVSVHRIEVRKAN